jgi:hypothetical protein
MWFQKFKNSTLKSTVLLLVVWKVAVIAATFLATLWLPFQRTFTPITTEYYYHLPYWLWVWGNFDGIHYLVIAHKGYELLTQPFFPLYPLSTWLTHRLTSIPILPAGLLVSHVAFFIALYVAYKLLKLDKMSAHAIFFFTVLLAFPTSPFYGAAYNDSLFFLFATLTLLFSRKKEWIIASIFGGLATLTRLNGLALMCYLVVEYCTSALNTTETWSYAKVVKTTFQQLRIKNIIDSGIVALFAIPAAFLGYLLYIEVVFGNWKMLFDTMSIWQQESFTFPPVVVWRYLKILFLYPPQLLTYWVAVVELVMVIFYCSVLLFSFKKIRLSYWLFIGISILIPWLTGTFAGMPRYGLHLYPLFLALTVLLKDKPKVFQVFYFIFSLCIGFFILSLFTRGYFVT